MSSRFNKMAAPQINLTAVGPPALGLLQSARDVFIDPIENLALDPGALRRSAEMIVLFTDFGLHGPYTGQMKAVLHQMAPSAPIIDLFSDAPIGNPRASAAWFSAGTVFLCVVDPGVGGMRPAIILEADSRWYVGPGNGLFELVQRRAEHARSWDIRLHAGRWTAVHADFLP